MIRCDLLYILMHIIIRLWRFCVTRPFLFDGLIYTPYFNYDNENMCVNVPSLTINGRETINYYLNVKINNIVT